MPAKPDGVMFSLAEIKRINNKRAAPISGPLFSLIDELEHVAENKIQSGESRGISEKHDFIKLSAVGKYAAEIEGGKPPPHWTIYRWINHGKQTGTGPWIKLKWAWKDGRRCCSKFQVRKFLEATRVRW